MEHPVTPDRETIDTPADEGPRAARDDLRALAKLRERVEAAAGEIERLRTENEWLARRVSEIGAGGATDGEAVLAGGDGLREKLDGFIAAIDDALREAADAGRR